MVVCPTGPGSFRLDRYDNSIHTREAICVGSTRIWCSLQLQNPLGRQLTQTSGVRAVCGGSELIALAQCNPGCLDEEIGDRGSLGDRPLEQPRGRWRYQVRSRVYRARRLPAEPRFGPTLGNEALAFRARASFKYLSVWSAQCLFPIASRPFCWSQFDIRPATLSLLRSVNAKWVFPVIPLLGKSSRVT